MSLIERRADRAGAPATSVIRLPAELDLAGVVGLRSMIADAVIDGTGAIVFDCADLTFIDASGIGALVRTANAVAAAGREVRLQHAGSAMVRMLVLTGVGRRFVLDDG